MKDVNTVSGLRCRLYLCPKFKELRAVTQIPHPEFRIVIYSWNEKFLLEIETGPFKQVFKVPQEAASAETIQQWVDDEFLEECRERFRGMMTSLKSKIDKPQA